MIKKNLSFLSFRNEMILFIIVQSAMLLTILAIFGSDVMFLFTAAAITGILLLETINYIEHYGLRRNTLSNGNYERVQPWHSWNSNHYLGRICLFELTRHSDHHYTASKKFQVLNSTDNAPQLPTSYPGMMLLSLFPPLWFNVMNPRVKSVMHSEKKVKQNFSYAGQ